MIGPHAGYARKMFGGYTHMCMMESTYAIANSIAGVSGVVQADADEIITVPGTNIQSDETEQFDQILKRQKPQCRNLYEEFQIRFPESEIYMHMAIRLQETTKVILKKRCRQQSR
ncbi:hypothetical protein [Blautia sp. TF12-12AT]|uniref:hypothetical protein n=1 Tax=Blautia sp. TF12-12AT TaxID=2292988 RepID=UPI001FAB1EB3|nr:hypothetical protein [Blautia sp. TF12-12AT]